MTNETKAALQQATEAMSAARAKADSAIQACLAQIATDLPARAADAAKRVAVDQPEVTKALGKEGVTEMRSALGSAAEELGREFVAATDDIDWATIAYSKVDNRHVHNALFKRFYRRTGALSQVLSASGYDLEDRDPFIPQALYDEAKFTQLSEALTALNVASANVERARKEDNDAAVDDLWGD
ncbi:hypothetical protein [Agrococcus sp. ProA11]|uniref:hypothetical protein n=1 Tax=Agrococcus chionoecetis TaxID=3153752 RepID=UPI003261AA1F